MKINGIKVSSKDWNHGAIMKIKTYLDSTIGEYMDDAKLKYNNEYIAQLIYLNCSNLMSLDDKEIEIILPIIALTIKYMDVEINENESQLDNVKNRASEKYLEVCTLLNYSLFKKSLTEEQFYNIVNLFSDKKKRKYFKKALQETKDLLENTNQLYLIHSFYGKLEPTLNFLSESYRDISKKEKKPKKR